MLCFHCLGRPLSKFLSKNVRAHSLNKPRSLLTLINEVGEASVLQNVLDEHRVGVGDDDDLGAVVGHTGPEQVLQTGVALKEISPHLESAADLDPNQQFYWDPGPHCSNWRIR